MQNKEAKSLTGLFFLRRNNSSALLLTPSPIKAALAPAQILHMTVN